MNMGHDLLLRDFCAEAVDAYTCAIELLRTLPLEENLSWANSLGAALMNRGQLVHRAHGLARADVALTDFANAIATLEPIPLSVVPWARRNRSGALLNRANLLLDLGRITEARDDAVASLALISSDEHRSVVDAGLALMARRALCDAIGQVIADSGPREQDRLAHEVSDIVDGALALVRDWSRRGEDSFAQLAVRFFRFGCELYRRHQPHFLAEFVSENLEAASSDAFEMHAIASEAVDAALEDAARPEFLTVGDPRSERIVETHRTLSAMRAALGGSPASPRTGLVFPDPQNPRSEIAGYLFGERFNQLNQVQGALRA
jgi:hypothetical protein